MAGNGKNFTLGLSPFLGIGVKRQTGSRSDRLSLRQLHKPCLDSGSSDPTAMQLYRCRACDEIMEKGDITHGYALSKNEYVELTDQEIKDQCSAQSDVLTLVALIPPAQVSSLRLDKSYFLGPQEPPKVVKGKLAISAQHRAYEMFRQRLLETGKSAVVTYTENGSDKFAILQYWDPGLLFWEAFQDNEIPEAREQFKSNTFQDIELSPKEKAMGAMFLDSLITEAFDFSTIRDGKIDRVRELVDAKSRGLTLEAKAHEAVASEPTDLLAALAASLAAKGVAVPAPTNEEKVA